MGFWLSTHWVFQLEKNSLMLFYKPVKSTKGFFVQVNLIYFYFLLLVVHYSVQIRTGLFRTTLFLIAELRRPMAAMRSPIPIEPMHSLFHVHLREQHMARGRVRTNDRVPEKWRLMAAIWCPAFSSPVLLLSDKFRKEYPRAPLLGLAKSPYYLENIGLAMEQSDLVMW